MDVGDVIWTSEVCSPAAITCDPATAGCLAAHESAEGFIARVLFLVSLECVSWFPLILVLVFGVRFGLGVRTRSGAFACLSQR